MKNDSMHKDKTCQVHPIKKNRIYATLLFIRLIVFDGKLNELIVTVLCVAIHWRIEIGVLCTKITNSVIFTSKDSFLLEFIEKPAGTMCKLQLFLQ